jgi:Flp pilus assembly pilin Flp
MNSRMQSFWKNTRAAAAVEFALVCIPLLLISVGIMEVSFALYQWLAAEKATEIGVRKAVVSDPVASGLTSLTGKTSSNEYGDRPMPAYNSTVCSGSGGGGTCTNGYTYSPSAMGRVVSSVRRIFPRATEENVSVVYNYAPLGFVGRPCGAVPSVTVRLHDASDKTQGMPFDFVVINLLAGLLPGDSISGTIRMPLFVATMTGEDLSSSGSAC